MSGGRQLWPWAAFAVPAFIAFMLSTAVLLLRGKMVAIGLFGLFSQCGKMVRAKERESN